MIFSLVCLICCTNVAITKHQIIEITVQIVINYIIVTNKLQTCNNIKIEKIKLHRNCILITVLQILAVIYTLVYTEGLKIFQCGLSLSLIVELINDAEEKT